ncbi:hypothetical protein ACOMHN_025536 [Nucella lapillus]
MAVFWRQGLGERINLCLFYLSLIDLLHMINNFLFNVDRFYNSFVQTEEFGPLLEFIVHHRLVGLRGLSSLSGFISMVIACERCLCVVSPLRSQTMLKTQTTAALLAVGTAVIMAAFFVLGLRWDLVCVFDPETNATSQALYNSQFYIRNRAQMNVLSFFAGTVQSLIYVSIVLGTTAVTSVKLRAMMAWRGEQSSCKLSSRQVALTRSLIALSVLYITCSTPIFVIGVGVALVPDLSLSGRYYNLANLLISLFKLTSFVNATFNFFVFFSLGSKYRDTLKTLFCCCHPVQDPAKETKAVGHSRSQDTPQQ